MISYLKASGGVFFRYRHLLRYLVSRDIKVKYRRSVLGVAWSVLNPLLMMFVYAAVFGNLFTMLLPDSLPAVATTGVPPSYLVYLLSGQVVFNFFSDATNLAMDSVLNNAQLIKKVYIPKYIFPLQKVLFSLVNTMFSLIALVLVMVFTLSTISWWILLAPVVMGLLFLFNLGVGLILSAAVVFFHDIKHLYSVFVLALTYLTPIFYTESIFVNYSVISYVLRLNPMYWYVQMFRNVVIFAQAPTTEMWIATVGCAFVALIVGLLIFRKNQDDFILHI